MYILVQVAAEAARAERQAHRKAAKKQALSENDQPPSNLVSILLPACVTTQPWTPLSSSAAPRGLPASLAPSSASYVVFLSVYASMISGASAASSAACTLGLECGSCLARGKDTAPVWQSSCSCVRPRPSRLRHRRRCRYSSK